MLWLWLLELPTGLRERGFHRLMVWVAEILKAVPQCRHVKCHNFISCNLALLVFKQSPSFWVQGTGTFIKCWILWKLSRNSVASWLQCPSFTVRHIPHQPSGHITALKTYYTPTLKIDFTIYCTFMNQFYLISTWTILPPLQFYTMCSSGRFWLTVGVKSFTINCVHI